MTVPEIGWLAIRRLETVDAAAALAVIHAAFAAQSVDTDPPSGALRETVASLAAHLAAHAGAGAVISGGFAGVVLWEEKDGGLYMGRLGVVPAWRGRGIARALVRTAEAEARRRGLPRLHLSTRLVLADNRRLFAACGFHERAVTTHAGYPAPTAVVMEKRL